MRLFSFGRVAAVVALMAAVVPMTRAYGADRPYGDARILATVPTPPGFPEGIAVARNRVYVAGPATFGTTGKPASAVVAFDRKTGRQLRYYAVAGEDLLQEHANSSIAFDDAGRLYVLNTQLGIYRLDPKSGAQTPYGAPFPNLAPCAAGLLATRCSPTLSDAPPIPNDLAFDAWGNAYVTDSMQATIWRVPAGGGAPQVWFQDERLASPYIGVNGIRIDPAGSFVYLTVTTDLQGQSFVYRLPLVVTPEASDLAVFHQFASGDLPDGIAFGKTGLLYVAMATPSRSGVSILKPDGTEHRRLGNSTGPLAPYDSPANIAFDGRGAILLSNHAFVSGVAAPSQFSIVDTFVDDKGTPVIRPVL